MASFDGDADRLMYFYKDNGNVCAFGYVHSCLYLCVFVNDTQQILDVVVCMPYIMACLVGVQDAGMSSIHRDTGYSTK